MSRSDRLASGDWGSTKQSFLQLLEFVCIDVLRGHRQINELSELYSSSGILAILDWGLGMSHRKCSHCAATASRAGTRERSDSPTLGTIFEFRKMGYRRSVKSLLVILCENKV
jgi:hypothetical protein